jgi:hypothetical protein
MLLNTIPCYYKKFDNEDDARNFGFALQRLGEMENEKYRYKILKESLNLKIIQNKNVNGYKLVEMNNMVYNKIIGELKRANFRSF